MDTNNIAWHARGVNTTSIGVEVSSAVYTKYAKKYKPRRPSGRTWNVMEGSAILGFTDEQVKALKVLAKRYVKDTKSFECPKTKKAN